MDGTKVEVGEPAGVPGYVWPQKDAELAADAAGTAWYLSAAWKIETLH